MAPYEGTPPPSYNNTMTAPMLSPKACEMLESIARSRELSLRSGKAGVTEDVPGKILSVSPNRRSPGTPNMEDAMLALSAPSPSPTLPDAPLPEHLRLLQQEPEERAHCDSVTAQILPSPQTRLWKQRPQPLLQQEPP